jgi:hypothetical protein
VGSNPIQDIIIIIIIIVMIPLKRKRSNNVIVEPIASKRVKRITKENTFSKATDVIANILVGFEKQPNAIKTKAKQTKANRTVANILVGFEKQPNAIVPVAPSKMNTLLKTTEAFPIIEHLFNLSNFNNVNNFRKSDIIDVIEMIAKNPGSFASFFKSITPEVKERLIMIFNFVDTYHDVFEGARGDDLKRGFKSEYKFKGKVKLQTFLTRSMQEAGEGGEINTVPSRSMMENTFRKLGFVDRDIETKKFVQTMTNILNPMGDITDDISDFKHAFVQYIMLMKHTSGDLLVIGDPFKPGSTGSSSMTRDTIKYIVKNEKLLIAIDSVAYSKHKMNMVGSYGLSSRHLINTPAQLADSANLAVQSDVTYIVNAMKTGFTYINDLFKIKYVYHFQCKNEQVYQTFEYYYAVPYVSRNTANGELKTHVVDGSFVVVKIRPKKSTNSFVKTMIIGDLKRIPPSFTRVVRNIYYDKKTQIIYCKRYTGLSVNELAYIYCIHTRSRCVKPMLRFLQKYSQKNKINDAIKMYKPLVFKTSSLRKSFLHIMTDIKRSQDTTQIDMINAINTIKTEKNRYFLMTHDILCASKAMLENCNVMIENKGAHYIVTNNKKVQEYSKKMHTMVNRDKLLRNFKNLDRKIPIPNSIYNRLVNFLS